MELAFEFSLVVLSMIFLFTFFATPTRDPRLCSGPHPRHRWGQEQKDAFLRWVQVCNHPWALAIGTPCKCESQQAVEAELTSRLERRKSVGSVGRSRVAFVPSASPTGPALPWSPGTSCSGPPPPYPELGSDHNNSPDPERGLRSLLSHHPRPADREAANKGRAWQGQGQGRCSGTNAALGQEAWTRVLALAEHRPWFHTEPRCPSLSSPKPAVGCCLSFQPTGHVEVGGKVTASDGPSQPPELFTALSIQACPPFPEQGCQDATLLLVWRFDALGPSENLSRGRILESLWTSVSSPVKWGILHCSPQPPIPSVCYAEQMRCYEGALLAEWYTRENKFCSDSAVFIIPCCLPSSPAGQRTWAQEKILPSQGAKRRPGALQGLPGPRTLGTAELDGRAPFVLADI